jgi:hypothetical protein
MRNFKKNKKVLEVQEKDKKNKEVTIKQLKAIEKNHTWELTINVACTSGQISK